MSDEMAKGIEQSLMEQVLGDQPSDRPDDQPNDQQSARDPIAEWADCYYAVAQVVAVRWPTVGLVYTNDRCEVLQKALHPIFEKWGLNDIAASGGLMAEVLPYLVAGAAIISVGKDTIEAVRHDRAQQAQGGDIGEGGERCA
jgi:hypothetical protein